MLNETERKELDEKEIFEILDHEIRRNILRLIYDKVEMSYSEILQETKIGDGTLNFHLRKMAKLLKHSSKGSYLITEKGKLVIQAMNTIGKDLDIAFNEEISHLPALSANIIGRRAAALIIDAVTFFIFTGIFFDPLLYNVLSEFTTHMSALIGFSPWVIHYEHLAVIGDLAYNAVAIYSHIFFAIYIFLTLLEAFKGQTPGKYLLGIRVVKTNGEKVGLIESGIRNAGKIFLLPPDIILGVIYFRRKGFIRFFDYYTGITVENVIR
jgi:uncharacterized RDD family membrane protein YckC